MLPCLEPLSHPTTQTSLSHSLDSVLFCVFLNLTFKRGSVDQPQSIPSPRSLHIHPLIPIYTHTWSVLWELNMDHPRPWVHPFQTVNQKHLISSSCLIYKAVPHECYPASGQVMGAIFWMEWIQGGSASLTLLYKHSCQSRVSCHCWFLCFLLSSFTSFEL